jgi:hypothetical protein
MEATILETSVIDKETEAIFINLLNEIEKAELNYQVDRKIWYARWREMNDSGA